MPLISLVMVIFGAVCIWSGLLGLAGREISVPIARGNLLQRFSGTEGRIMGGVLLAVGLFLLGAGLGWV